VRPCATPPLTGCDLESAIARANELRELVAGTPVAALNSEKEITVSMGVAVLECGGDGAQALLSCADAGLYAAKGNGRNRVEHFASTLKKRGARPAPKK
jgi:diguanylate cyclase (GGDEF)-like protein